MADIFHKKLVYEKKSLFKRLTDAIFFKNRIKKNFGVLKILK